MSLEMARFEIQTMPPQPRSVGLLIRIMDSYDLNDPILFMIEGYDGMARGSTEDFDELETAIRESLGVGNAQYRYVVLVLDKPDD